MNFLLIYYFLVLGCTQLWQPHKPLIIVVDLCGQYSRSWENLLNWWPDNESFTGVFKDIVKLDNVNSNPENVKEVDYQNIRPPPLGEHHEQRPTDEEYI